MRAETGSHSDSATAPVTLPAECIEHCLLAQREDLEERGIFLTRSCPGPRVSYDDIDQRVGVKRDGTAVELPQRSLLIDHGNGKETSLAFIDSANGERVCRNRGANLCIDLAIERGEEKSSKFNLPLSQQIARELFGETKEAYEMGAAEVYLALVKRLHGITEESDDDEQRFAYATAYRAQLQDASSGTTNLMRLLHTAAREQPL